MTVQITDHALVRFLERVMGIDIEAVRAKAAATPGLAAAIAVGARSYSHGGCTFRLDGDRVITIQPCATPMIAAVEAARVKHGHHPRKGQQNKPHGHRTGTRNTRERRPLPEPDFEGAE
jgi:hypothetical protein